MEAIDKTAQGIGGNVFCDEGAARLYGGKVNRTYGLWTGACVWTVRRHAGVIQGATIFFLQDRFVTEMGHGVHMRAWTRGMRWRACDSRDGLVSIGA